MRARRSGPWSKTCIKMKPIDFSRETYATLKPRLAADKQRVYQAWADHGPGTTREVATRSGIDILTFRPRTTDLVDLGLVRLVEDGELIQREVPLEPSTLNPQHSTCVSWQHQQHGTEGTYKARTLGEWQQWLTLQREAADQTKNGQLQMI
jgi:hypothetical protein